MMRNFSEDKGLSGAQLEFRQLQQELTGATGAKLLRFLTPEIAQDLRADLRSQKRAAEYSQLVMLLLTNALYRQTYEQTLNKIGEYERRAEQALERIRQRKEEVDAELRDLRSRAARLRDGTQLYRDQNGAARAEDGTVFDGPELEAVIWPENAPSYEAIAAVRDERAALEKDEQAIERYQVEVLGEARNRLENTEEPPDLDELDAMLSEIEELAPPVLSEADAPSSSAETVPAHPAAIPEQKR